MRTPIVCVALGLFLLPWPTLAQPWGADSQPTRTTAAHGKRVIGYLTQWDAWKTTTAGLPKQGFLNHLNLDYSQYTHLNFSFFGVAQDGSLHSGDFRNQNIWQTGQTQSPAPLLNGDVYSSWDYYLVWGNLNPQWNFTAGVTAAGFESYAGGWRHVATGLTGPMPVPYHPPGTAPGVLELAHANGVKVLASIGGWSMCKHFPETAADPVKRARFLADCQRLIALGFDGIDLDWEYPGPFAGMNFTGANADYANFLTLLQELRAAIGPTKEISSCFSATPAKLDGFDWPALAAVLDSVNLMTYDFQGGWSDVAGHNAPLYPYPGEEGGAAACSTSVGDLIGRGAPRVKIAMGVGFYGRGVVCSNTAALGAATAKTARTIQPDGPIVSCADYVNWAVFDGTPTYTFIRASLTGWTRHWDTNAQAPFLSKGQYFLSYDDSRSVGLKAEYARTQNLGGVIIWNVFGDLVPGPLQDASAKLPFAPATDAPLVNVLNSVLAGDAVPPEGTEGPVAPTGPLRGLNTLATNRPIVVGYLNALRDAQGQDQVITNFPAAVGAANLEAFDIIACGFAEPKADGTIGTTLGSFANYLPAVVNDVHASAKSVVVSIGGAYPASLANQFAAIATSATLRDAFASNVVAFLQANQLDGVDIDYEFPADAGMARSNFTALMAAIHTRVKAADARYLVMFGGGPGWYLGSYDFAALSAHCDFFFYFGYDWKNPANGPIRKPGSTQWTTANDQLPEASVKGGVDYVLGKGFPASKLVVGLPFYGSNNRSWSAVRNLWAANPAAYLAAVDTNSLEVLIDGEWFTTPDALKLKLDALLNPVSSVLAGQAAVRGAGCWEIGHEHASHPDLSGAFAEWLATYAGTNSSPALSIAGASTTEGNSGSKPITFTVTLQPAAVSNVTVQFATTNSTAVAGDDYLAAAGTLTFAPGETNRTITVTVLGNTLVQSNRAFKVMLSQPVGATLAIATATGTILDDDAGPGPNEGWVSHAPVGGLSLSLQIIDYWGTGFQGQLLLANHTGTNLTSWTIQFDAAFTVSSMWDGVYGGKTGSTHSVSNPTWGGYMLANNSTGIIGFTGAGATNPPANLRFNGQLVGNGGVSYATWSGGLGWTTNAPYADTDADGAPNLIEFLFAPTPLGGTPPLPEVEIRSLTVNATNAPWFCLVMDVNSTAADAEYRVVGADNLAFVGGRVLVLHETTGLGNGWVRAVWRDTAPLSAARATFARIEARMKP